MHAAEVLAGEAQAIGLVATGGEENRVASSLEQRFEVLAGLYGVAALKLHPQGFDEVDFVIEQPLRQAMVGDAVAQEAAGLRHLLIHGDGVALASEAGGGGEAGGAGADDRDLPIAGGRGLEHLHLLATLVVGQEGLQLVDADRLVEAGAYAALDAQPAGRADLRARGGEDVVLAQGAHGAADVAHAELEDPLGGVCIGPAAGVARGVVANQAAAGFGEGRLKAHDAVVVPVSVGGVKHERTPSLCKRRGGAVKPAPHTASVTES